ncbi:hypothetical protein HFP57_13395 [Parasphingopyxis algicola]|uniref:hypothetical protein n=1 Tax=Parasphingopyxis algicola TaxID=2026624 RepID=UPI0015A0A3F3|nr:hypothetical protein [Parasphingopyxis algicola]QLC25920.1 hypothetical protein HFP57_13395 [Parasphingopyxis algicola]
MRLKIALVLLFSAGAILAFPIGPISAQTRPDAASGLSPADARRLRLEYELSQRTLAAIARILQINYPDISGTRLTELVEQKAAEATALRRELIDLRATVSRLSDPGARDPAAGILNRATQAFDDGRLAEAEQLMGELSALRRSEYAAVRAAWVEAISSQARLAELQGGADDYDRADGLWNTLAEFYSEESQRSRIGEWRARLNRARGRYQQGYLHGDRSALDRSIEMHRNEVLPLISEEGYSREWAETNVSLGLVLRVQGERIGGADGIALFDQSIEVYRRALSIFTLEESPVWWANASHGMGLVFWRRGQWTVSGDTDFAEAASIFRSTLAVYNQNDRPRDWAITQINLGITLMEQQERARETESNRLLGEAINAFRSSLTVYRRTADQSDWALAQLNLGRALRRQGARTAGAAGIRILQEANLAHENALQYYTRSSWPTRWADMQDARALTLGYLGERTAGNAGMRLLLEAVLAQRDAMLVYTRSEMPIQWAQLQNNHGLTLRKIGARVGGTVGLYFLLAAERAILNALEIWTPEHSSYLNQKGLSNLRHVHETIAGLDPQNP